ncbi:hypothetical protein A1Q1_00815 [Trichosporon asahii var. asahii CBS 2479]|uniref:Uncharacterized protein n=1 Tax=Trichosporon asahii var. asahii (strain ATCC 90039 / CBS 2479 / JCM 2466 / KCTC 7840 / NBRC 103889/ NCYC 2677 / UAMH 7654) TaxID=1186058 RepID=J6EZ72_TRIAS|nr:hypothetical protein A1Q1_00815 [Trichosporon asahii var. asahii CBS 2479]EJT49974.1 hypothetical protein A1Q1_00815 [Trichosporon asahii var. asahii CBS 2479]
MKKPQRNQAHDLAKYPSLPQVPALEFGRGAIAAGPPLAASCLRPTHCPCALFAHGASDTLTSPYNLQALPPPVPSTTHRPIVGPNAFASSEGLRPFFPNVANANRRVSL